VNSDIGQGLPFRPGIFDGVISISAVQWLCYASSSDQDARAVLQFYPENEEQVLLIAQTASKVGFAGGIVVDYPNSSKAKKYYLCLSFERSYRVPTALLENNDNGVRVTNRNTR
jgi:18S rRNA (guanine1575-N7)-methyltransferase